MGNERSLKPDFRLQQASLHTFRRKNSVCFGLVQDIAELAYNALTVVNKFHLLQNPGQIIMIAKGTPPLVRTISTISQPETK